MVQYIRAITQISQIFCRFEINNAPLSQPPSCNRNLECHYDSIIRHKNNTLNISFQERNRFFTQSEKPEDVILFQYKLYCITLMECPIVYWKLNISRRTYSIQLFGRWKYSAWRQFVKATRHHKMFWKAKNIFKFIRKKTKS